MACQLVSRSVSYFGLGAASRSCNNRAAEGRAGGEWGGSKSLPGRRAWGLAAGRSDEEEINSGVKCSALVPQIAACGVRARPLRRPRARVRRAAALPRGA